jgi:hypothetical protein
VGGRQAGRSQGIHWHVDPDHVVRYRADAKRQTVYEVEMAAKDGTTRRYKGPAADSQEAQAASEWRTMDCVDCHNRPTHVYREPARELDAALLDRRIDPSLPYVRREGLKALLGEYPTTEAARAGIAQEIADFYAQSARTTPRMEILAETEPTIGGRPGRRLDTRRVERLQTVVVWPAAEPDLVNVVVTNDLPDERIAEAIDAFGDR